MPPCGGHPRQAGHLHDDDRFKSCPRVGGIVLQPQLRRPANGFKSCPRVGGIAARSLAVKAFRSFKSCPRVGGIRSARQDRRADGSFKSCPRVGGIWPSAASSPTATSFKSCPRVGGIQRKSPYFKGFLVSSRAPVWGASFAGIAVKLLLAVSSRAPVWGASRRFRLPFAASQWFQVVPPCGGHPGGAIP